MNNDMNPNRHSDLPEDALTKALDDLMKERSSGSGAVRQDAVTGQAAEEPCPEPGEWLRLSNNDEVAVDPAESAQLDALLAHAALCAKCAGRLRSLSADVTPEELAAVDKLASASTEWQHNLAAQLARTPRQPLAWPARKRAPRFYMWAGAALAACLVMGVVAAGWWQRVNTPERLMAEAYTNSRIFDMRMPGAGFAEVTPETHLRGGAAAHESTKLTDARNRIEGHLANAPDDPHWLQLEARADVLEENFDPAIEILDKLIAAGPVTSSLLTDDAAAYFERGDATGSESDRATALEYLRHADELTPGDPVVLFNEAVAMEDRGQMMNAVETWNRYLRFERDPRWLDAGRKRLQALEQKLNQLKTHQSRMEQNPDTFQAMHPGDTPRGAAN